jgi:hypothetical protein
MQAALEPAGRQKWYTVFSAVQCREIFLGLGVQDIAELDSD